MDIQGFRVRKSTLDRVENIRKKAWLYVGKISGSVTFQPTQLFSCVEPEIQQERNWTAERICDKGQRKAEGAKVLWSQHSYHDSVGQFPSPTWDCSSGAPHFSAEARAKSVNLAEALGSSCISPAYQSPPWESYHFFGTQKLCAGTNMQLSDRDLA